MSNNSTHPHNGGLRREDQEREVRQLLEEAGRRPEIPQDDFRVIKAATRAEWQQFVDARKGRRRGWRGLMTPLPAAAGILLALLLAFFWWQREPELPPAEAVATIELFSGDVWLEESLGATHAIAGGSLTPGTELVTGDSSDGRRNLLAIRLANDQSLRLDSGTRARLDSTSRIELIRGAVYVDSGLHPSDQTAVEISTPFGSVVDVGTQFEVRLGDEDQPLRVRVRSGSVFFADGDGEHTATAGEELLVRLDGSVARGNYGASGGEWDWILSAAPALAIDGLALTDFLDWVAAETGLEVRYEDEVLVDAATAIELHGSIEGLRPDEAIIAVLPGTGLAHEVDDGTLSIRRLPPGGGGV